MNILVPDSWLREFLVTKATPGDLQKYLSLCGPSIERVNKVGKEIIYDIEITSNRPDSMSILGIAREAAAILPRFGIATKLLHDPYSVTRNTSLKVVPLKGIPVNIKTDPKLNPRLTSVVLTDVKVSPSPKWLRDKLESTGIRSLNNVIDITNYLMRAYGQPAHAFDYDEIKVKKGVPTMILRASRKGEKIKTLDGKTHILPGDDIVIEDGSGRLIDLCGIMGAENSSIKSSTKNVVLFLQTYDPSHIRKTMMSLAHRTEAGSLFEKGTDPELVMPAILKGMEMIKELAGGAVASKIYDIYPSPYKSHQVSVFSEKLDNYLGIKLSGAEIKKYLLPLGFKTAISKDKVTVTVPSFRRDISINVDIIEEIARVYGYHNVGTKLPDSEPPIVMPDKTLIWEEEIKIRLRDWGFTELYTYSMISEKLMDIFELDRSKAYKITNPLSEEWVYLRPHLTPSVLAAIKQNLNLKDELKVFELSMTYGYRPNDLPTETPTLIVVWTGNKFREAKGLAEAIFKLFGIDFPASTVIPVPQESAGQAPAGIHQSDSNKTLEVYGSVNLSLGEYGSVGEISQNILSAMGIDKPVTRLYLDFSKLVAQANPTKKYVPIPKYPASFEDLAFIVPPETPVGQMIEAFRKADPLIAEVSLLDSYQNVRTLHVTYQSKIKNLTSENIQPVRENILHLAKDKFGAYLKSV